MTTAGNDAYPATLSIDYPDRDLDRVSTAFRLILVIPILIVLAAMTGVLAIPAALMIIFRQKYPRWWYDFNLELTRFTTRVTSYFALMSDEYPSTDEDQYVHLDFAYPDVKADLNRWLPLVKWFLAIPHYIVLAVLGIGGFFAVIGAWFAILFTGRYPRGIFDFVEGLQRWGLRVQAYSVLLTTDEYPPFSLS
ncbi:MAG: DUF4389 domain-containing protein [bacterium]|nr:DUF4389 domain-containing protein [bacterium]